MRPLALYPCCQPPHFALPRISRITPCLGVEPVLWKRLDKRLDVVDIEIEFDQLSRVILHKGADIRDMLVPGPPPGIREFLLGKLSLAHRATGELPVTVTQAGTNPCFPVAQIQ